MTRRATSKLGAYAALSGFGLLSALLLGGGEADGATARLYRDGGCSLITVATDALAISHSAVTELATAQA